MVKLRHMGWLDTHLKKSSSKLKGVSEMQNSIED